MTLFELPAPVVHAAYSWPTNAHLIEAVAALGWLKPDWLTLDATYGEGKWWDRWRPDQLVTNDLHKPADHHDDYRNLHFAAHTFDASAFDPPYVLKGGRTTSGIGEMDDRFGMETTPLRIEDLQAQNHDGLTEIVRVTKPDGIVLVKYQNQVSSGRTWPGTHLLFAHALTLGLELEQEFIHMHAPGPQPNGRSQQHARNNYSVLYVFRRN